MSEIANYDLYPKILDGFIDQAIKCHEGKGCGLELDFTLAVLSIKRGEDRCDMLLGSCEDEEMHYSNRNMIHTCKAA